MTPPLCIAAALLLVVPQSGEADRLFDSGVQKLKNGNLDGAIVDFTKVIELDPRHVEAWSERGLAKHKKGLHDEAIEDFSRALYLDPKNVMAARRRAASKGGKGDAAGAIEDYSLCIRLDPRNSVYFNSRGNWRLRKGDLDGALADHNHNLQLEPKSATGYYCRARVKRERGDVAGALADINQAIELNSKDAPHHFEFRGCLWYDRQAWKEALADFKTACEMAPTFMHESRFRIWLVRSRLDEVAPATADLSAWLRGLKEPHPWTKNVGNFLLGEMSEEHFLLSAKAADEIEAIELRGEAFFYVGCKHLLAGKTEAAAESFEKAAEMGQRGSNERFTAAVELKRLRKKSK